MSRTEDEVMTHHINTMMKMDLEHALSDYSEDLIAITRLDGRNRTLGYDSLSTIMENSYKIAEKLGLNVENAAQKLKILCRQSVEGYVVLLAELKPFSSFASFTYMVEDGRAIYVTGYAKTLSIPSIGVKAHPFEHSVETIAEHPFVGKDEILQYSNGLLEKADAQISAITAVNVKYTLKEAVAEIGCIGFAHRSAKQHGVLTQRVQGERSFLNPQCLKERFR